MVDKRNDERTDEEVMKKKQTNIRNRMALEKEEKEAEMEVRKKERAIPHSAKDEPYFAQKYLGSSSVASMRCPCGHTFGQTAGNYQAWMHYTHADPTKPSMHEREVAAKAVTPAKTPRNISSFFGMATSTTATLMIASPVEAPAPMPTPPAVGLGGVDAPAAEAIVTTEVAAVRPPLSPPPRPPQITKPTRNIHSCSPMIQDFWGG